METFPFNQSIKVVFFQSLAAEASLESALFKDKSFQWDIFSGQLHSKNMDLAAPLSHKAFATGSSNGNGEGVGWGWVGWLVCIELFANDDSNVSVHPTRYS